MKFEEARSIVSSVLPEKRYQHSVGVSETCVRLAERYGADVEKAALAGILHDIAKYFSGKEQEALIRRRKDIGNDFLDYSDRLWHAPAGAVYVQEKLGITDPDVFSAILYHTTGQPEMSLLEKILFVADYIEPGRSFPGVEAARAAAEKGLDQAAFFELQQTIIYLLKKEQRVYPLTFEAYNNLAGRKKR